MEHVFGAYIEHTKSTNLEKIQELLKEVDILKEVTEKPPAWDCDCLSSFNTSQDATWKKDFCNLIMDDLNKYINKLNPIKDPYTYNMSIPWVNLYKKGQYQEVHTHLPDDISYCYYHKIPKENGGDTIFQNINIGVMFLETTKQAKHTVTPKDGDIVVFTSDIPHFTSPNMSDEDRITISGNIRFKDYE